MKETFAIDDILRARPWLISGKGHARRLASVALQIAVFGALYGAVMGSFGGFRAEQMLYSAIKVPLLLTATFAISLPSFFVMTSLLGLRDDFAASVRAIFTAQVGLAVVLCSLAPLTMLWYASVSHYQAAIAFNLLLFTLASLSAQVLLRGFYRPLIEREKRHRLMMWIWLTIYAFVGVQMAWILRPFIGHPGTSTTFFREEAWGNAYTELAHTLTSVLGG